MPAEARREPTPERDDRPALRVSGPPENGPRGEVQLLLPMFGLVAGTTPAAPPAAPPELHERWRFRDPATGAIDEVDVIVATPDQWAARPESRSPLWSPRTFRRGVVVAVRLALG